MPNPVVLVTGFGPFGPHKTNASLEAVLKLPGLWTNREVRITFEVCKNISREDLHHSTGGFDRGGRGRGRGRGFGDRGGRGGRGRGSRGGGGGGFYDDWQVRAHFLVAVKCTYKLVNLRMIISKVSPVCNILVAYEQKY